MKDFVDRPQAEDRKIHSKNEFELCYMRHQYFRKVTYNPSETEMAPYKRIAENSARNTFYTYRYLFSTVGMELDDLVSIAKIHLVNFLGLFAIDGSKYSKRLYEFFVKFQKKHDGKFPKAKDVLNKNKADYTLFMKQRMTDLVRISQQKAKNIKGSRVDEYIPFYGNNPPPDDLQKLLEDNESYGFRRLDTVAYKAAKKKMNAKTGEHFKFAGSWYVAVPLVHRNLTILDFAGAGYDPYESNQHKNPEQLFLQRESDIRFDKRMKMFKNYSKEKRIELIQKFVSENSSNTRLSQELVTAKKMLKKLGAVHVE
jgi:hypothetical protein